MGKTSAEYWKATGPSPRQYAIVKRYTNLNMMNQSALFKWRGVEFGENIQDDGPDPCSFGAGGFQK